MAQSKKFFFALLLALFLHLAILQVRFGAGTSELSPYNTTEIGLVQISVPQKTVSTVSAESTLQISHDSHGVPSSSVQHVVETENLKPPFQTSDFVPRSSVAIAEIGALSPERAGENPVSRAMHGQKLRSAEKLDKIASVPDAEKIVAAEQIADVAADRTDTVGEKIDSELTNIEKTVHTPTGKMSVVQPTANSETERLTAISGVTAESVSPSGRNDTIAMQKAIPRYETNPRPVYPDIALRKGWEGLVLLRVDVKKNGRVERVGIEKSSGFTALDRAALKAVRRWQFTPATSVGLPVAGGAMVPINFELP